jgi:gamma-glutamylcyclotransferase (GGCT)/AIG2-like uncharacterized protein YtfP
MLAHLILPAMPWYDIHPLGATVGWRSNAKKTPFRYMRLFLYGTLLDPDLLAGFAGRPVALVPATLRGWRRVALPNGRYSTLRRARGTVAGALAAVDRRTLERLAVYEGPAYRLRSVVVRVATRNTGAWAWIAPGGTSRAWPPRSAVPTLTSSLSVPPSIPAGG